MHDLIKTRLAPTPSGFIHLGNIYSFIITWLVAKEQGGNILLRIDDLDKQRIRREYIDDIFHSLHFLGLHYDEGPADTDDFLSAFSQQHRLAYYWKLLDKLVATGKVYACICSRKDLDLSHGQCYCRQKHIPLDSAEVTWRIVVPSDTFINISDESGSKLTIDLARQMPDFVIKRKDDFPAYQVASLCDDILYNVNYIVRGKDLLPSTAAQLYLAQLAGENGFLNSRFFHHPLIDNGSGEKMSKSAGSVSLQYMVRSGASVSDIIKRIATMPGFTDTSFSGTNLADISTDFSFTQFLDNLNIRHTS